MQAAFGQRRSRSGTPSSAGTLHAEGSYGGRAGMPRFLRLSQNSKAFPSSPTPVEDRVSETLATPGEPLPASARSALQLHFGRAFPEVRVHADAQADEAAQSIQARAFASGNRIVVRPQYYAPETKEGLALLAHELTHVVQQEGIGTSPPARDAAQGDADSPFEREASDMARAVREGTPAPLTAGSSRAESPPKIQKLTEEEHESLGNVTGVDKIDLGNGVILSWGQLVAIGGDHYANEEDLLKDTLTPAGRTRILARMKHSGISAPAAAFGPAPTKADEEAAAINELTLGLVNTPHFVAGGSAVASWTEAHERAIFQAVLAGLARDRKQLDQAYFIEAFGQHYLTDAFSSGHLRTPRQAINDYYANDFAPRVVDHVIETLRERVVDEVYDQMDPFGAVRWPLSWVMRRKIRSELQDSIDKGIAAFGGHDKLVQNVGLFLGSLVSRALHDLDNKGGLVVSSADHPEPWQAYGDRLLDKPDPTTGVAVNRQEAEKAILQAKLDVDAAYAIAETESRKRSDVPLVDELPESLYFDFNSDELRFDVSYQTTRIADYMTYHPDVRLSLVGHADPLGTDPYNLDLGMRRAEAIAKDLEGLGVESSRLRPPESKGETDLVTTDPKRYALNRRVTLIYEAGVFGTSSPDIAAVKAWEEVRKRIGPPYAALNYLPEPVDGLNPPVKNYTWGNLPYDVQWEMADYLTGKIQQYGKGLLDKVKALPEVQNLQKSRGIDLPVIVERILKEIEISPIRFMERVFDDRKAGP